MRPLTRLALVMGGVLVASTLLAPSAEAQRRFRTRVFIGGYYGHPYFGYPYYGAFYNPFFYPGLYYPGLYGWGPYYPQAYPPPWTGSRRGEPTVRIRTDVSPKDTQLFVDGYFRGIASDFVGLFKGLRLEPGRHELVLYLQGYKTIRRTLDMRAGSDYRVEEKMVPLAEGETNEPPPTPVPPPPQSEQAPARPERAGPPPQPAPEEPGRRVPRPPGGASREPWRTEARGFGAIAIRVQPEGAEVLIDGERWEGHGGPGPMVVQLTQGSHRVEVRMDGYDTYRTEVRVREGETVPLNVSLPERR